MLAYKDLQSAAYKVGSNIYQWNREGKFKLEKFNGDANKVAKEVNIMMGVELISGREIQKCYQEKRVGQSPPRIGKPPIVPKNVFRMIC